MHIILATTSSFGKHSTNALALLKDKGFKLITNPYGRKLKEEELILLLEQYHPIGVLAGTEPITRAVLEKARGYLKVISRVGVGWDNVDREAAQEFGIKVYRTPGVLNEAVAELTFGMILCALRSISLHDRNIRQGLWQKGMGRLLQGKTVGIIGFGSIGQQVGKIAKVFNARIIYYDPIRANIDWAEALPLHEMLPQADIITIHASGSDQILAEYELNSLCKQGVILVNTARGGLVDEKALYKALVSGKVAFACLDVFETEPYNGPLCTLDNVILTPHIGSYALESRIRMEELAVENLIKGLALGNEN